jgi:predicted Ser/Thr protein kinase
VTDDCPPEGVITRLDDEPDAMPTEILAHVAACPSCQRKLELTNGPLSFRGLSSRTPHADDPNPWFLDRMKAAVRYTVTGRPDPGLTVPGYEIEAEVARGGMGVVYRARDTTVGRTVAVKMLPPEAAPDPDRLARFLTEAKALAALQHPNVVQLFHAGEAAGRPFLVMEFVTGGTLRQSLRAGPWDPPAAAKLVRTLADATAAAHKLGIVHRDLKPGNVLLSADDGPVPKVADFGLARFLADDRRTASGEVLGTPEFMAPEQASGRGEFIGPATDVWALGATLYEVLTGRPPFTGVTPSVTLEQVRTADPVPPSRLRPGLPPELCAIGLKCLEKDPRNRYPSAAELRDDLDRFLAGKPVVARPRFLLLRWLDRARRHPLRAAAGAVGVALVAAGVGFIGWEWFAARTELASAAVEVARLRHEYEETGQDLYAARVTLADRAVSAGRPAEANEWLAACQPDERGWEWNYLANSLRAASPARVELQKHEVTGHGFDFPTPARGSEAISPDRRRRVAVGPDGGLAVHDDDGRLLVRLPVPGTVKVVGLHFSQDGRWLAARTEADTLLVYDGGQEK